jgi:hypothetical protein
MAVPVWVPGQVLAAADVNRWFVPDMVVKGSDQNITSSITLTSDSALFQAVEANALYTFNLVLLYTAISAANINMMFIGPAGATMNSGIMGFSSAGGGAFGATTRAIASAVVFGGTGIVVPLFWQGTLQTSSTAGTFQFQWAQSVSNGTAATVKAGSSLSLVRSG